MNLSGSRFLEIVDFTEKMFMSQESWTLSTSSLFLFSCIQVRKKNSLVDYVGKYLALLDGMLCRRERFIG